MRRILDLLAFFCWDRSWRLRPFQINVALRIDQRLDEVFLAAYYHYALHGLSKRGWRYLESRYPQVVILWCCSDMPAMSYKRVKHAP